MTQEPRNNNYIVPIVVAIIGVIGTIIMVRGNIKVQELRQEAEFTQNAAELTRISLVSTSTQTPTQTPSLTPAPTYTLIPIPIVCPYEGPTDNSTIVALIEAEAVAAQNKDMETLKKIFASNATFRDIVKNKTWDSVEARYENPDVKDAPVKDAKHFDIRFAENDASGQTAYYTSGSEGYYYDGVWQYYFNGSTILATPTNSPIPTKTDFGSEHWTLKKDANGCWVIAKMEFNAGHIPFP